MTELEYGIGIANKFDLLCGDEDPSEVLSKPVEKKKKEEVKTGAKTVPAVLKEKPARSAKAPADSKGEKKVEGGKAPRTDNRGGQKRTEGSQNVPQGGQQQQQRPPRSAQAGGRPSDNFGKENTTRPQREGQQRSPGNAGPQSAGPRRFNNNQGPRQEGGAPRRAPMDQDNQGSFGGHERMGDQEVPENRVGFGGGRAFRGGASYHRAQPRHFGTRDAGTEGSAHARGREFERHSGSNKTGVKPVDKREGGGAHNWGSFKDEAEQGAEAAAAPEGTVVEGQEGAPKEPTEKKEGEAVEVDEAAQEEEKSMTMQEYLAQQTRVKPTFATRAANEGESEQKVFQKMKRVQRENANADGMVEVVEYVEVDAEHGTSGGSKGGLGGPFQLVFAPAARPDNREERGDRPDRGERGGRGGRGGPGGRGRGGQRGGGPGGFSGGRGGGGRGGRQQAPPAVDDLNFPSLG